MNGYMCLYKGKQYPVFADTTYEAQTKLAKELHVKKQYLITVVLAEKDGAPVTIVAVD